MPRAGGGYGFGPQVTGGENVLKLYVRSVLCTCDFYSFLSFYPLPKTLLINGIRLKHLKIAMCVSQKRSNTYFIFSWEWAKENRPQRRSGWFWEWPGGGSRELSPRPGLTGGVLDRACPEGGLSGSNSQGAS